MADPAPAAPDPRSAVLRSAGHDAAADLLDSLNGLQPSTAVEPGQGAPAPQDPRQAQAEGLLAALHRDTQGRYGAPLAEEPAR